MTDSYNENSGKKAGAWIIGGVVVLALGAAALYLVDVDQTQEAKLPAVSVDVEDGQVPKFDVDVADVDVGMKKSSVTVPTMDVETKTIEIEVPVDANVEGKEVGIELPTISVDKPAEDDPADNPK